MKNFKLIALALLAVTLIFSSCGKDEETIAAPTIAFQNGTDALTFTGTESIDVRVDVTAEGKIASFKLSDGVTVTDITDASGKTEFSYLNFQKSSTEIGTLLAASTEDPKKAEYTFTVIDKEGNTKSAVFTVTMAATTTPLETEKTGMFFHIAGQGHGAYDLDGDATVASAGASSSKSLVNTDAAGETFTGKWVSENGTEFVKANNFDYENATVESAGTAFSTGTPISPVIPAVNDIYIAKKGSTYYAIKITNIDPNAENGGNDGKIEFSYKKQ